MCDRIATWSPLLTFLVSASLFAWCLLRAARSVPSLLLALLLGCFAVYSVFEWLWWFTGTNVWGFVQLEYIGVSFAPTVAFHYGLSLNPPTRVRTWALTAVYSAAAVFVAIALAGFANHNAFNLFKSSLYNEAYLAVFLPVVAWTVWLYERSRRRATDPRIRALFAYPLAAALLMAPVGFLEIAMPVFDWKQLPHLASFGALTASVVLALGVFRHRAVYDSFAVLRQDSANVLRATVQGVIYLEPDGRVIFCNSVARELLGGEPRTLAETGLEVPAEGRSLVRRGNRILEIRTAKSTDVFPPGRMSLILQDKTRDFELMQTLASREALAALGQGAATLAHEIRNPLTAINSTLDCVVHDIARGEGPEDRHLDLLRGEVARLNNLLERTLEFSRPLKVNRQPCDLNALIRRIVEISPTQNGSRVSLDLAERLPALSADPDLVVQVVINLLKNGIEASHDVRVATAAVDGAVSLKVTSAGAKIPEEALAHLFEPFYTTKVKGTGLGLALSKKVVAAHDGEITGRNGPAGAEFEVRLPT